MTIKTLLMELPAANIGSMFNYVGVTMTLTISKDMLVPNSWTIPQIIFLYTLHQQVA